MPESLRDMYTRVTHAISKMRSDRVSLSRAAREFGVTRLQIQRFGAKALRRGKNGKSLTKTRDPLLRVLRILTPQGLQEIAVNDSMQASMLGDYWNAVDEYLITGDDSLVADFRGKRVTDATGDRFRLLTDLSELDRLGSAGMLSFESLYARTA